MGDRVFWCNLFVPGHMLPGSLELTFVVQDIILVGIRSKKNIHSWFLLGGQPSSLPGIIQVLALKVHIPGNFSVPSKPRQLPPGLNRVLEGMKNYNIRQDGITTVTAGWSTRGVYILKEMHWKEVSNKLISNSYNHKPYTKNDGK